MSTPNAASGSNTPGMLANRADNSTRQGYSVNKPQASLEQAGGQSRGVYTYAVEEIEDRVPEKLYR